MVHRTDPARPKKAKFSRYFQCDDFYANIFETGKGISLLEETLRKKNEQVCLQCIINSKLR